MVEFLQTTCQYTWAVCILRESRGILTILNVAWKEYVRAAVGVICSEL